VVDIQVVNVPDSGRYEARVDGVLAGFAAYQHRGDTIVFTHTRTEPDFEGHGVASALARGALDDVRAQGQDVVPLCPFINAFIAKHEEYQDLVSGHHPS
jgi:hypothetical protein